MFSRNEPEASATSPSLRLLDYVLLGLLVVLIHGIRIGELTLRGEETRRGLISREMLASGDWLVPTVQGVPRLTRPPLHYWAISSFGLILGDVDLWAIRLPSLFATLATTLMTTWYATRFLSRSAALIAGIFFATFPQVVQLGNLGETEAIFTFLLASALLTWHAWQLDGKPNWGIPYLLAGLATLAKGPQGPVYFFGTLGGYHLAQSLLFKRFPSRKHLYDLLTGILVFSLTLLAWLIPFWFRLGYEGVAVVFGGEVSKRFADHRTSTFLLHLFEFPAELIACLFPWSFLPALLFSRKIRQQLAQYSEPLLYLLIACGIAFPTVWLPPEANTRYLMPLYPLAALIYAILFDLGLQNFTQTILAERTKKLAFGTALLLAGLLVLGMLLPHDSRWHQPAWTGIMFLVAISIWIVTLLKKPASPGWFRIWMTGLCSGWVYTCGGLNYLIHRAENVTPAISRLHEIVPEGELKSIGIVHHLFTFHYKEQIEPLFDRAEEAEGEYFVFDKGIDPQFDYEELMRISCDRHQRSKPDSEVIVARKLSDESSIR